MAATKKKLSTKKIKRPSFTAPTPPEKDEEVLENSEEEVATNSKEEPVDIEPAKPTPPSKMITKEGPDKEASFDQVIKEESPQKTEPEEEEDDDEQEVEVVELEDDTQEEEATPPPVATKATKPKKESKEKSGSFWKTLLVIVLIVIGLAGWVLFLTTKYPDTLSGSVSLPGSSEPTPAPTQQPALPSPTPVDKSGVKIEIYNGVGISGAAGATADTIEEMGYTIIDTGNADSSGYEVTEIEITPDFPEDLLDVFLADLEKEYGTASISGELEEALDSGANTQITLGADWFPEEE